MLPSRKTRSLVWKNWSRMPIFSSWFRDDDESSASSTIKSLSSSRPDTMRKKSREQSLTITDFNLRKHYHSLRQKAKKIYQRSDPNITLNKDST